ncbi:acireductone synthase [Streptomyces sioyaensis]|uniref:acireductone synthase n=1 Tax=Streptomyces sioyaensis TaxID=67364 RepID=UPI00340276F7
MSQESRPVCAIVLDIEGTTGSITYVHEVLFPYARARLESWVSERQGTQELAELTASIGAQTGSPHLRPGEAVAVLKAWSDADVKAGPLKAVQAAIWAEGYRRGDLSGHVYPDVPAALERWKAAGNARYIYSSGALQAQRDWFAHTAFGDLTPLLDGYFDLTTAGGKREPASYRTIARAISLPGGRILFASDVAEELDAAAEAGWQTLAVRRPHDPRGDAVPGHRCVSTLDGVDVLPASA